MRHINWFGFTTDLTNLSNITQSLRMKMVQQYRVLGECTNVENENFHWVFETFPYVGDNYKLQQHLVELN